MRLILLVCLVWSALLTCACGGGVVTATPGPSDPEEMYRMGMQYGMGDLEKGIPPDHVQSRAWLERAAGEGHLPAVHALAWIHYQGRGVARDPVLAALLFTQAAAKGYAESQYQLGLLYAQGEGVGKDGAASLQWIRRAADQGHPEARKLLEGLFGSRGPAPRQE